MLCKNFSQEAGVGAQIAVADDAGDFSPVAGRALFRHGRDELCLADAAHRVRTALSIFGTALHEYGLHNRMTGSRVFEQIFQKILRQLATGHATPQVVMWVDDLARRIDDFFVNLREPGALSFSCQCHRLCSFAAAVS